MNFTQNKITYEKVKYITLRYIQEILEAFVAYTLFKLISNKQIVFSNTLRLSMVVGFVTLILEEYNTVYKNSIKNGILANIGSEFVKH